MAAMLVGAVMTSQFQRPEVALARPAADREPATAATPVGPLTLETFRDITKRVNAGVVNINTSKVVKRRGRDPMRDFFGDDMMDRFFGPQGGGGGPERQTQRALGSGFVIDKAGYVLTNRHVVEGADEISVTFVGGKTVDAKLVGRDARTDVALLKIESKENLTALELGDSDQTDVGEWVMAIGNPFGLGGNSVTVGVVSYKGRALTLGTQGTSVDMIQTDASINPGNSGGPLINTRGQVIGINTLIITQGVPQSSGVGFAVPINVAKEVVPQIREKGKVVRGWLGLSLQELSPELIDSLGVSDKRGALVSSAMPGGPAAAAGLQKYDVILSYDKTPVEDYHHFQRLTADTRAGSKVILQVLRNKKKLEVPVTVGEAPEEGPRRPTTSAPKS